MYNRRTLAQGATNNEYAATLPDSTGALTRLRPCLWNSEQNDSQRLRYIDVARGLLLVWMIISHALGRSGIPKDHLLQWLRPHGWATFGFVMISGFTVGMLFQYSREKHPQVRKRLWRRCFQIAVIAYLSNSLFISVLHYLDGGLAFRDFFKIASLQVPWGYSAILIPTVLFLTIAPFALRFSSLFSPLSLLLSVTLFIGAVDFLASSLSETYGDTSLFQIFFQRNSYVIFPIGNLFLYSVWAFYLGYWLQNTDNFLKGLIVSIIIGCCLFILVRLSPEYNSYNPGFVAAASRFPIIIGAVLLLSYFSPLFVVKDFLGLIGRSALLVYIFHRPLLQAVDIGLNGLIDNESLAGTFMILGICIAAILCYLKEWYSPMYATMKRIGF